MPAAPATQRVLIIGAGYVGSALGMTLRKRGADVVATTTTPARVPQLAALGLSARVLEVGTDRALPELLADREVVFLTLAPNRREASYRDVYLASAQALAGALSITPVRRIIYTSSTSVYAQDDGSWVDEDSVADPVTEAGRILRATESVLLAAAATRPLDVSVVRLAGIHGPGRDLGGAVARHAGTARDDGNAFVNLIHRDDAVTALARLAEVDHHGILNLGDDRPVLRRVLYDAVLAARNAPPVTWRDAGGPVRGKRVANRRIKALLGLVLRHPGFGQVDGS